MRQRPAIRNGLEYGAALFVLKSLEWAPVAVAHGLARGYSWLLDLALPRLRRVAYRNLSLAMPERSADERAKIVDGVFRSVARLLVTVAKFPAIRRENLAQWIRCEGGEYFEQARSKGHGVLFATDRKSVV